MRRFFVILFFCGCAFASQIPDFYLMTVRKSGSHLFTRILTEITGISPRWLSGLKYDFERKILVDVRQKRFLWTHFYGFENLSTWVSLTPTYKKVIGVRDPRDALVSAVFWISEDDGARGMFDKEKWFSMSFDEQLMMLLTWDTSIGQGGFIRWDFDCALRMLNRPDVFILKFEDVVGGKGGGSEMTQRQTLKELAYFLEIELSDEKIDSFREKLFGNSQMFRKGQTQEWKIYFKPHHIEAFKKRWDQHLIQLGYAEDGNW